MVKRVVKVYLSKEQMEILDRICQAHGMDRSGFFEHCLALYAKDISLVEERVHRGEEVPDRP